jgi:hypothetical protein
MASKINYQEINKALADKFGDGQVELRKAAKDDPFTYVLWFRQDDTPKSQIDDAKKIVAGYVPTHWRDDLMRHVESEVAR